MVTVPTFYCSYLRSEIVKPFCPFEEATVIWVHGLQALSDCNPPGNQISGKPGIPAELSPWALCYGVVYTMTTYQSEASGVRSAFLEPH